MYLIANISNSELCISDIGIVLQPKQAIDLDKVMPRNKSESSLDLRHSASAHLIRVLQMDRTRVDVVVQQPPQATQPNAQISDEQIDSIKNEIKSEIIKQLSVLQLNNGNQDVSNKIDQLMSLFKDGLPQKEAVITSSPVEDIGQDIDINDLTEIHAKTVKRLSKDSQSNLSYAESKSTNKATDRVSELEDLLG